MELHHKLGDFVRIAPNHISIADPTALPQIYGHKAGLSKGPFYDAFHQIRPVIFMSRDLATHQRKRKCLNPAFSARNLKAFEPYMSSDIKAFKSWVSQITDRKEYVSCDMSKLLNYLAFDIIASYSFGKSFGFLAGREDREDLVRIINRR
jgi:benzoate 4-monooxygenase